MSIPARLLAAVVVGFAVALAVSRRSGPAAVLTENKLIDRPTEDGPPSGCWVALPEGWVGWEPDGQTPGLAYQAVLLGESDGPERGPVEASLAIVFQTVTGSNDPAAMVAGLSGVDAEIVYLPFGIAVRRSGRRVDPAANGTTSTESFARQYYVPVPGTTDQIAVVSCTTPLEREAEMSAVLDKLAQTFTFTWS